MLITINMTMVIRIIHSISTFRDMTPFIIAIAGIATAGNTTNMIKVVILISFYFIVQYNIIIIIAFGNVS